MRYDPTQPIAKAPHKINLRAEALRLSKNQEAASTTSLNTPQYLQQ